MPIPSVPDFLKNVICHSGNTFPIPENTESGTGDLSYAQGWPALTSLPISAGGIAPRREYFNAVYQLLSKHIFFMQSGGVYPWSPGLNYLVNCHVQGSDGKEYIALRPSGPDTPGETGFVGPVDPVTDTTRVWSTSASSGGGGAVLLGTVTAFSGNFGGPGNRYPIPLLETQPNQDWVLCDGVQTNGLTVPDLRGRMILGMSSQYPRGSVGGAYNHTHTLSGTVGDTTLTVDQLAEHTHTYTASREPSSAGYGIWGGQTPNLITGATGSNATHTHELSDGEMGQASSLPPYYSLAYIMKIA